MTIEQVVHHYFPQAEITSVTSPKGGISADLSIVSLRQNNRLQKIVVRQIGSAAYEFQLLKTLQSTGLPIPNPLFLDEGRQLLPTPFVILKHIAGEPLYRFSDAASAATKIGRQLASIHAIDTNHFDLSFLPTGTTDLPNPTGGDTADIIFNLLKPVWPLPSLKNVLLHGDFWPGNLLWQDGELAAVIDWEGAKVGNPLQDLAISRFDTLFIFGRSAMQALTESYFENSPIDPSQLAYWDLFAALRAIPGIPGWAAGWGDLGRPDLTETAISRSLSWFIQQATSKIN